ncbi:hypothetical protein ACFS4T_20075 [Pseudomonas lini]
MGSSLYACDGNNGIHAFDAETGKELWRRDISNGVPQSGKPCRGVAYYKVPDANGFLLGTHLRPPATTPRWWHWMRKPVNIAQGLVTTARSI